MNGNLALGVVLSRTTRRREEETWEEIRIRCSIDITVMLTAGRQNIEVLPPGRVFALGTFGLLALAGQFTELHSCDEVVVAEADGAAEGTGFNEVDDGGDVAVEAAVAVDER